LITLKFSPQATEARSAELVLSDNAPGGPQTVVLTGIGTLTATLTPTSMAFGNQGIDSPSIAKNATLLNKGNIAIAIASINIGGANSADFSETTTTCGATLAAGVSRTIGITFLPAASGARVATLVVADGATNTPQTATLSGTGVQQVALSSSTLAFGNEALGSSSAQKVVTLTNNESSALSVGTSITGPAAAQFEVSSNTCGSSVAAHSSCKIGVIFAPTVSGAQTATLTIADSANNSPQTVALSGTGVLPVSVTPASLPFSKQNVGTTSAAKVITIKNVLPTSISLTGFAFGGANPGDFVQTATSCAGSLASGAACTASVSFAPAAAGARAATLNITDTTITSPQVVSLSGTGK
jgi:hypothetical protein